MNPQVWHEYKDKVNQTPYLKELRDWVEANSHGYGDRPLYWMWHEILASQPSGSTLLEIGVYKGQTLALWAQIAKKLGKVFDIYGVTPLTSTTDSYHTHEHEDYESAIQLIHNKFNLPQPNIIKGLSQDVHHLAPRLDVLFIDGGHDEEDVRSDINHYVPLLEPGGILVFDDASCNIGLTLEPTGHRDNMWYPGLDQVSRVVDEFAQSDDFTEILVLGHNRVFKREN